MSLAEMTDEQISILAHVEALIAPLTDQVAALRDQIKSSDVERAGQIASLQASQSQLSERVGKVEAKIQISQSVDDTRNKTLKLIAASAAGTITTMAALGGFILAILAATSNHV